MGEAARGDTVSLQLSTAKSLLEGMRPKPDLVAFAHALVGEMDDPSVVGALITDPGQFAQEFVQWVNAGRPATGFLYPQTQDPARELDVDMDAARDAFLLGTLGVQL